MVQLEGKQKPIWVVHLLMLLCASLVSTSFIVGKIIAPGLDPAPLTLVRFGCAALLFLPYTWRNHGFVLPKPSALARYLVISGTLVGFFWLMFLSLRYTTALHTGVIFTLVPGISGMYSAVLLKERLGGYRLVSLLLAMVGAIWVIFKGDIGQLIAFQFNRGDLLFFAGCLLMALYTPLIKLLHRGESMTVMTFWILVAGCFWLLLLCGYTLPTISWSSVPMFVWAGILYLAIFTTIITFFINQWATLRIGPTRVMAYSYLYPPLIILLEWAIGKNLPPVQTMLGVLLIVPAMFVVQQGAKYN